MKNGYIRLLACISNIGILCATLFGCSSTPPTFAGAPNDCISSLTHTFSSKIPGSHGCYRAGNNPGEDPPKNRTRGTTEVDPGALPDGKFIGIAFSGGGSRAANFSAAVLYYLKTSGLLDPANSAIISSVSGGSLTAAYFAVYGDAGLATIKEQMAQDFQGQWERRWFYPGNALRYWFTSTNRTDLMAGVLDDNLFGGKWIRYADLKQGTPKIVINSTSAQQKNFSFTDGRFDDLNSRLDNFPLAYAVAASAAFPGVFQSVALQDYSQGQSDQAGGPASAPYYLHLFDGGPSDNLGVDQIQQSVLSVGRTKPLTEDNCLIVVVDSYLDESEEDPHTRDVRGIFGRVLTDPSVFWAMDTLLTLRRFDALNGLDYWSLQSLDPASGEPGNPLKLQDLTTGKPDAARKQPIGQIPVWTARIQNSANKCTIWHLNFDRLNQADLIDQLPGDLQVKAKQLFKITNATPTLFYLKPYESLDSAGVQDALFCAADILVTHDKVAHRRLKLFLGHPTVPPERGAQNNACDRSFGDQ